MTGTNTSGNAYSRRNKLLKELGYEDYQSYRESSIWLMARQSVLVNGAECISCFKPAEHVHHLEYDLDTLQGKTFDRLVPVCNSCHYVAEFDAHGNKRSLGRTNEALMTICRANGKSPGKLATVLKEPISESPKVWTPRRNSTAKKKGKSRQYRCKKCNKLHTIIARYVSMTACSSCKKRHGMIRVKGPGR